MKLLAGFLLFFMGFSAEAQQETQEHDLQEVIETFFNGFHQQDSLIMKSVVADSVIMRSIGRSKEGNSTLHEGDFNEFLKAIVSLPSEMEFKEVLHSFTIQVDGDMANVWTPYSFYINSELSHCGVNNFQLFNDEGQWKIIYLIDTRRKNDCGEE